MLFDTSGRWTRWSHRSRACDVMLFVGLALALMTVTPTGAVAAVDCGAVLARCQETPERCQAGKLKRCVRQGIAVCAMTTVPTTTTTTTTVPEHCSRCPTAHCQADGTTCEECTGASLDHIVCEPGVGGCCIHPPLPTDCASIPPSILAAFCSNAPPGHGCCLRYCAQP